MDKCPTIELGVQDTHLRLKKKKIQGISFSSKFQKIKKSMYPLRRAQVELDFNHCYHHHHHTPFIRHTCTSWFDLLACFFGSMVWLYNKCLISMYILSPTYEAPDIKSLIRVGWERRQCHYALYHKYHIFWEKAYTITALVRIQKYHKKEIWESHTRNLWVLFENLQKL